MNKSISSVVDTSHSPGARLCPVPLNAVVLRDLFWAPRLKINREVTLPSQYQQYEAAGHIDNFRRVAGTKDGRFQGKFFYDSDIYKWLEATAWTLAAVEQDELSRLVDTVVDAIAAAQQDDGYLNTYFVFERAGERWSNPGGGDMHELYCAGHLMQAAVAHFRATGNCRLLAVAQRLADHIEAVFGGPNFGGPDDCRPLTNGHPEIEMALVELARATGESKYLRLAQFFIEARGRDGKDAFPGDLNHVPLRQMHDITGHAVCSVYLRAGATDLCAETGDTALYTALVHQWENMTQRRMYLTGGVGARYKGEAFGSDYELPNARAYAETCAAIASVMWNWRMLQMGGEARFADIMEQTLYNGALSGLSLDGQSYFYQNPLADDGTHRRQKWFDCACCPSNIARLLASLPSYFYSVSDEAAWVHLYAEGSAHLILPDGRTINLHQHTRYPWDGEVAIEVASEGEWELHLRIPGWCGAGATVQVNDESVPDPIEPASYISLRRAWRSGDTVRLHLPMPVRMVQSHPHVMENIGKIALMRGPLLYCLEAIDHTGIELRDVVLPPAIEYSINWQPNLLGGVTTLHTNAMLRPSSRWEHCLYSSLPPQHMQLQQGEKRQGTLVELTAVPYYAWANREAGPMQIWLPAAIA